MLEPKLKADLLWVLYGTRDWRGRPVISNWSHLLTVRKGLLFPNWSFQPPKALFESFQSERDTIVFRDWRMPIFVWYVCPGLNCLDYLFGQHQFTLYRLKLRPDLVPGHGRQSEHGLLWYPSTNLARHQVWTGQNRKPVLSRTQHSFGAKFFDGNVEAI